MLRGYVVTWGFAFLMVIKVETLVPTVKIILTDLRKLAHWILAATLRFGIRLASLCRLPNHPSSNNISLQFGQTGLAE